MFVSGDTGHPTVPFDRSGNAPHPAGGWSARSSDRSCSACLRCALLIFLLALLLLAYLVLALQSLRLSLRPSWSRLLWRSGALLLLSSLATVWAG